MSFVGAMALSSMARISSPSNALGMPPGRRNPYASLPRCPPVRKGGARSTRRAQGDVLFFEAPRRASLLSVRGLRE